MNYLKYNLKYNSYVKNIYLFLIINFHYNIFTYYKYLFIIKFNYEKISIYPVDCVY